MVFQAGRKAEGLLHAMSVMVDVAGMRSLCSDLFSIVYTIFLVAIDIKKQEPQ